MVVIVTYFVDRVMLFLLVNEFILFVAIVKRFALIVVNTLKKYPFFFFSFSFFFSNQTSTRLSFPVSKCQSDAITSTN